MKTTYTILALLSAVWTFPQAAAGQDIEGSIETASVEAAVTDDRSLAQLRRDVFEAEEDFYALFNTLNDDKEYDVRCFYEKPTGTRIENHVCRARFVTKAFERHARRNRNNLSSVANQDADPVFAEKTARYQEIMEALIAANPELEAALVRYNTERSLFMALREQGGG